MKGSPRLMREVSGLIELAGQVYADHAPASAVVDDLRQRLGEPLRVAVAGRIKTGKSTLLNALVGEPLAASHVIECTRLVTWYRYGPSYRAFVQRAGQAPERAALARQASHVDVSLGEGGEGGVDRVIIEWPADRLRRMTMIDTPGLASLTSDVRARTTALLVGSDAPAVDAVIYVTGHIHPGDVAFLEALRDDDIGEPADPSSLIVLGRADEIGAARSDAMDIARRIADRYRADRRIARFGSDVVAVASLLAFGAGGLTETDFRHLAALSGSSPAVRERLLRSADDFVSTGPGAGSPADAMPSLSMRRTLVDKLGLFGIRLSCELILKGTARTASELARQLTEASGLDHLRRLLDEQFTDRADLLKAERSIAALRTLGATVAAPGRDRLVHELERIEAGAHEVQEHRLLRAIRSGTVELAESDVAEITALMTTSHASAVAKLGWEGAVPDEQIRAEVIRRAERWRTRAFTLSSVADLDWVAETAARSYEGMLLALMAPRRPGDRSI